MGIDEGAVQSRDLISVAVLKDGNHSLHRRTMVLHSRIGQRILYDRV